MAKYKANPVIVDAFKIEQVVTADNGSCILVLDNGRSFTADPGMTARYIPTEGDYFVRQKDGYVYINPREVFELKYSALK